ncbi:unnamed protein product, partial [Didymodactylos carnosus]
FKLPSTSYITHYINTQTLKSYLLEMIPYVRDTQQFTIDTETDHRTGEGEGEPSLIQIQPVTTVGKEQIILIETKQLP